MPVPVVTLVCHPETRSAFARGVWVRVRHAPAGSLALTFAVEGEIGRLRIPLPCATRRAERLWEHTCFEAFVAARSARAYYELNFAPSGEWAAYAFRTYRQGEMLAQALDPNVVVRRAEGRLELDALIRLELLAGLPSARLRLALSAVLEDERGALSFWAIQHPAGKPDFHHPDAFALEIGPPDLNAEGGAGDEAER
jgi:hypothetical protein